MAENPLIKAHARAGRDTDRLGVLFGRLGNLQHPDSGVLVAYRNANRALRDVMQHGGSLRAAKEVTRQLKASVKEAVLPVLAVAAKDGAASAKDQIGYYGGRVSDAELDMQDQIDAAFDVMYTSVQKQETALTAFLLGGADEGLILGDEGRQGVLRPADVIGAGTFWIAALFWDAFSRLSERSSGKVDFSKQVVAAIDNRTTDCCLRAHGQIVGLKEKFHLTGTPRYADYLDWTPFHGWCRSSVVLYLPGYDDGLTDLMTESARQVLAEREAGENKFRWPVDAFVSGNKP